MERREALKTMTAAMATAIAANAFADDHDHDHDHDHHQHDHGAIGKRNAGVIAASSDCLKTGEACLAHCLYLLGTGNTDMAACATSVNETMAICQALLKLASQDSKQLPALAKIAADTCTSCEKECRKHEKKHQECKDCADSCAACLKECKKLAT